MINTGSPIQTFVKKSLDQIQAGLPENFKIAGKIDFELSVATSKSAKGGLNVQVVGLGGDVKNENTQRIRFSVVDKKEVMSDLQNVKDLFEHLAKLDKNEVLEVKKIKKK